MPEKNNTEVFDLGLTTLFYSLSTFLFSTSADYLTVKVSMNSESVRFVRIKLCLFVAKVVIFTS